jgi:uncharacterized protein YaaR (DUF327 family)
MRVIDRKGTRQFSRETGDRSSRGSGVTDGTRFVAAMQRIAGKTREYSGKLKELKEEIDSAGDTLDREPSMANFKVFRELLGTIARTISVGAYRMEQVADNTSHKIMEVITVIDKEADTLYHLIMKDHKDHIRISAQIMKIKGLVIDFLV